MLFSAVFGLLPSWPGLGPGDRRKIGADGNEPFADVMTINRPDGLDDIANVGLTVADGSGYWQASNRRSLPLKPGKTRFAGPSAEAVVAFVTGRITGTTPWRGIVKLSDVQVGAWFRRGHFWVTDAARKSPTRDGWISLRERFCKEAANLPGSSAAALNWPEAQQRQPMRMALAGHQFPGLLPFRSARRLRMKRRWFKKNCSKPKYEPPRWRRKVK
jgi:hypothetical protein